MADSTLYRPQALAELLSLLDGVPGITLYAGGTEILRGSGRARALIPDQVAYIGRIPELLAVTRAERYVDVGAAVPLAQLAEAKACPDYLAEALRSVANAGVRNLATLGGNLCTRARRMDLWAPLSACEAKLELRRAAGARWVGINRFVRPDGALDLAEAEVLARVRIPVEDWNLRLVRRIGPRGYPAPGSAMFCCLGLLSKDAIQDVRFAWAGETLVRDRTIENELIGRRLPLDARQVGAALEALDAPLAAAPGLDATLRAQYKALFRWSLGYLQ